MLTKYRRNRQLKKKGKLQGELRRMSTYDRKKLDTDSKKGARIVALGGASYGAGFGGTVSRLDPNLFPGRVSKNARTVKGALAGAAAGAIGAGAVAAALRYGANKKLNKDPKQEKAAISQTKKLNTALFKHRLSRTNAKIAKFDARLAKKDKK